MLGAIAGDIVGSVYEGGQCDNQAFALFGFGTCFTDDTVCTVAVADALMGCLESGRVETVDYAASLRKWVSANPGKGYGGLFINWAHSHKGPYDSFGNGGAMRVSAIGRLAPTLESALRWAQASAEVTHNHPQGVEGARAIAAAIWLASRGASPAQIEAGVLSISSYGQLKTVEVHRFEDLFNTNAQVTVPIALACALEANSWEEAVRNACYVGGDCDTIACMAGGIAEARFGIPVEYARQAWDELTPEIQAVVARFYDRLELPLPSSSENTLSASRSRPSARGLPRWRDRVLQFFGS